MLVSFIYVIALMFNENGGNVSLFSVNVSGDDFCSLKFNQDLWLSWLLREVGLRCHLRTLRFQYLDIMVSL